MTVWVDPLDGTAEYTQVKPTYLQCCGSIRIIPSRIPDPKLSEICSGCSSRISDPDLDFLPIPESGSRDQKGTGSRIRNTAYLVLSASRGEGWGTCLAVD
jgi:hypothetical protein